MAECYNCDLDYQDDGFQDLIIEDWAWRAISPSKDEGGLLCPTCLCKALQKAQICCYGSFTSGMVKSVDEATLKGILAMSRLTELREKLGK